MTTPLGAADFFALEAGEYLERLGAQVGRPEGPVSDEFMRFTRALRGSALMAKQSDIAHAASGLEALARHYRDGHLTWTPVVREAAGQAIEELKLLVRAAGGWTDAHRARAQAVAKDLADVGGHPQSHGSAAQRAPLDAAAPPAPPAPPAGAGVSGASPGVRAFVAREGALIASALDRAAMVLRSQPTARDPLETVTRRMQSLRGLAELSELPPLPEILEGIELATGALSRMSAQPPNVGDLFDAAAKAISRMARDVANRGRPDADAEEARRFTDLLFRGFAAEDDVVGIATLAPNDGEPQIVERGTVPPRARGPAPSVQLVSTGEHLRQAAADLRGATSETQRDLRLIALLRTCETLRAVSSGDREGAGEAGGVEAAVGAFGRAAHAYIVDRHAIHNIEDFAQVLEQAGEVLRDAAGEEASSGPDIEGGLRGLVSRLAELPTVVPAPSLVPGPAPAPAPVAPPPAASPPARALPPGEVVPISALAPDEGQETERERPGDLAASFVTFARLLQQRPAGPASLDAFLEGGSGQSRGGEQEAGAGEKVVAITSLLYHGRGALDRAAAVRAEIHALLAGDTPWESVRPLVEELLDLVPLAQQQR